MDWEGNRLDATQTAEVRRIRWIINGMGYMGKRGLLSFLSQVERLQRENNIETELAAIVDPNDRPLEIAQWLCESLPAQPVYARTLRDAVTSVRKKDPGNTI